MPVNDFSAPVNAKTKKKTKWSLLTLKFLPVKDFNAPVNAKAKKKQKPKDLKQFNAAWPCKYLSSWSCNFMNMSAINPGETQESTWGSKEFCHESFSPGVHLKISTLGNPLFCAWCPHIKINHMKILNLFTKLMKQSFSFNDHQIIPQNCSTVLNFQK